ncbi:MAG: hypothetical protein HKL81_07140 [Acidimicrobiaceae bacterium]|nr:hypothetical protein [Acidimicrobiaceae bacterium]
MSGIPGQISNAAKQTEFEKSAPSLPPIGEIGVGALILIVIGGIYMSSQYPRGSSLAIPSILAACSGGLLILGLVALARSKNFARELFFQVGKWTLIVYVIVAGMLEYVFIYDGTRGNALIVLSAMLLILAVDVPLIISFTVARFTGSN